MTSEDCGDFDRGARVVLWLERRRVQFGLWKRTDFAGGRGGVARADSFFLQDLDVNTETASYFRALLEKQGYFDDLYSRIVHQPKHRWKVLVEGFGRSVA